jgi:hypothetical protein
MGSAWTRDKKEQRTRVLQHPTDGTQDGPCNTQETRCDWENASCNMQPTTRNAEKCNVTRCDVGPSDRQHTPRDMGHLGRPQENRPQTMCSRNDPQTAMPQTTRKGQRAWHHWRVCNRHHDSCNMQGKCNGRHAACDSTTSKQHAPCSGRHAKRNKQRVACNRQHAPDFMKHAASNNDMQRNRQHAPGNGQRAACNRTPVLSDGVHRATNMQQGKRQQGNMHSGLQQTTGNGQHATDNVHQTADGMQEDASSCVMQQETHGTAAFRVRRAAGSGQPASMREALYATTCAQHGTDITQDETHARCHSMQQTQTEPTTRSRQCNYEMRRTQSGRSRTSGHAAAAHGKGNMQRCNRRRATQNM